MSNESLSLPQCIKNQLGPTITCATEECCRLFLNRSSEVFFVQRQNHQLEIFRAARKGLEDLNAYFTGIAAIKAESAPNEASSHNKEEVNFHPRNEGLCSPINGSCGPFAFRIAGVNPSDTSSLVSVLSGLTLRSTLGIRSVDTKWTAWGIELTYESLSTPPACCNTEFHVQALLNTAHIASLVRHDAKWKQGYELFGLDDPPHSASGSVGGSTGGGGAATEDDELCGISELLIRPRNWTTHVCFASFGSSVDDVSCGLPVPAWIFDLCANIGLALGLGPKDGGEQQGQHQHHHHQQQHRGGGCKKKAEFLSLVTRQIRTLEEIQLVNEVLSFLEERYGVESGSIRLLLVVDTIESFLQLESYAAVLSPRRVTYNCDFRGFCASLLSVSALIGDPTESFTAACRIPDQLSETTLDVHTELQELYKSSVLVAAAAASSFMNNEAFVGFSTFSNVLINAADDFEVGNLAAGFATYVISALREGFSGVTFYDRELMNNGRLKSRWIKALKDAIGGQSAVSCTRTIPDEAEVSMPGHQGQPSGSEADNNNSTLTLMSAVYCPSPEIVRLGKNMKRKLALVDLAFGSCLSSDDQQSKPSLLSPPQVPVQTEINLPTSGSFFGSNDSSLTCSGAIRHFSKLILSICNWTNGNVIITDESRTEEQTGAEIARHNLIIRLRYLHCHHKQLPLIGTNSNAPVNLVTPPTNSANPASMVTTYSSSASPSTAPSNRPHNTGVQEDPPSSSAANSATGVVSINNVSLPEYVAHVVTHGWIASSMASLKNRGGLSSSPERAIRWAAFMATEMLIQMAQDFCDQEVGMEFWDKLLSSLCLSQGIMACKLQRGGGKCPMTDG